MLSSTLRSVLIARLVDKSCKTQEKPHIDVSISVINFVTETLPERYSGFPYIKHHPASCVNYSWTGQRSNAIYLGIALVLD